MTSQWLVLSERIRFRHRFGWRHVSSVRHKGRPRISHVFTRQHHLRHHFCCVFQEWPTLTRRIWRFQLQCMGLNESRTRRWVTSKQPWWWKWWLWWWWPVSNTASYAQVFWPATTTESVVWVWQRMVWQWPPVRGIASSRYGINGDNHDLVDYRGIIKISDQTYWSECFKVCNTQCERLTNTTTIAIFIEF